MPYQINETIVLSGHGIGRITGLVDKTFGTAQPQPYYEVLAGRSTVWVAVGNAEAHGLRPLTNRAQLGHCRELLRSQPRPLDRDYQKRRQELHARQKIGTLEAACELVRDLSARNSQASLNDVERTMLQGVQTTLCEEWAAVDGVSLPQANSEVTELLLAGRQQPRGAPGP